MAVPKDFRTNGEWVEDTRYISKSETKRIEL